MEPSFYYVSFTFSDFKILLFYAMQILTQSFVSYVT